MTFVFPKHAFKIFSGSLFVAILIFGVELPPVSAKPVSKPVAIKAPVKVVPIEIEDNSETFKLNVNRNNYLPPAMYGTWNIIANVLTSDAPSEFYAPSSTEIWTLQRDNEQVTLTNPVSNAVASITVDNVSGDTATFHHVSVSPNDKYEVRETPTVTVTGDKLKGVNVQEILVHRGTKIIKQYTLKIEIAGTRISGARVSFGQPTEDAAPRFEVAPMEFRY